jgi:hypothetical protein
VLRPNWPRPHLQIPPFDSRREPFFASRRCPPPTIRPCLDDALSLLLTRKIRTLYVVKLDRLTRRGIGHVGLILDELEKVGGTGATECGTSSAPTDMSSTSTAD